VDSWDKSCVTNSREAQEYGRWETAFSNNILRAGKHYATFDVRGGYRFDLDFASVILGVMRPGQVHQNAKESPFFPDFFRCFSRHMVHGEDNNNSIQCCMYGINSGNCIVSNWRDSTAKRETWEGLETMWSDGEIGMLLDLDEGTLTVYKNGQRLGVMKKGLAGPYCWVVSMHKGTQITLKRGTIPPS